MCLVEWVKMDTQSLWKDSPRGTHIINVPAEFSDMSQEEAQRAEWDLSQELKQICSRFCDITDVSKSNISMKSVWIVQLTET